MSVSRSLLELRLRTAPCSETDAEMIGARKVHSSEVHLLCTVCCGHSMPARTACRKKASVPLRSAIAAIDYTL